MLNGISYGTAAEVQLVGKINKTNYSLNNYIFDMIKKTMIS